VRLWEIFSRGEKVCLDTSILIYHLNGHKRHFPFCRQLIRAIEFEEMNAVISTLTEMELLVEPLASGRSNIVVEIEDLLRRLNRLVILPVDRSLARVAADLRARTRLRSVDALVAATALATGCRCVVGNDREFAKRVTSEIEYVVLDDLT